MVKNKHGMIAHDAGFACDVACTIHSSYKWGGRTDGLGHLDLKFVFFAGNSGRHLRLDPLINLDRFE